MKTLCLAAVVIVLAPASARAEVAVMDGPRVYGGHTYFMLAASSWSDAEETAVTMGAHLATINNADEDAWVYATFGGSDYALWIGLNDVANEGTFVWTSGEQATYTNWATGEPAGEQSDFDYVNIHMRNHPYHPGKWNDWPDAGINPARGVVEVAGVVPEPASLLLGLLGLGATRWYFRKGHRNTQRR